VPSSHGGACAGLLLARRRHFLLVLIGKLTGDHLEDVDRRLNSGNTRLSKRSARFLARGRRTTIVPAVIATRVS